MRANEDVDFSGFGFLQNFFLLLRIAEAADHFDRDRKRRKALLESFKMLKGEHGSGREHGDLFVVADGLESRAHGYFGFAIPNVTAEQTVHGLAGLHVADHVFNGIGLIFGLVEFEGIFKLSEPFIGSRKSVSDGRFALGIKF